MGTEAESDDVIGRCGLVGIAASTFAYCCSVVFYILMCLSKMFSS
jgi:hypothetical protein